MSHASGKPSDLAIDLKTLSGKVQDGQVDTVLIVFPDTYGRLVGKRLSAQFFLDHCAEAGTHGCNYLLTVNMEMDPLEGFKLASWEQGYGDFAMRPDLATLRLLPWQKVAGSAESATRAVERARRVRPRERAHKSSIAESELEPAGAEQLRAVVRTYLEIELSQIGVITKRRTGRRLVLPRPAGIHALHKQ